MKLKYCIITVLSFLIITAGLYADQTKNGNEFAEPMAILGGGYSSDMEMAISHQVINGTSEIQPGEKEEIPLHYVSFSDVEKLLNPENDTWYFDASMAADYLKHIQDSRYSESFSFIAEAKLPKTVLKTTGTGEAALTDYGKMIYARGPNEFRKICGDKYISEITYGAALIVTFKFTFDRGMDKYFFDKEVKSEISEIIKNSKKLKDLYEKVKKEGETVLSNLEISAYQLGGEPQYLATIFKDKTGEIYNYNSRLQSNKLDSLDISIIDGINNYCIDFFNQVDNAVNGYNGTVSPLEYSMKKYADLNLVVGKSLINDEILSLRKELLIYYNTSKDYRSLFYHLVNIHGNALKNTYKEKLSHIVELLDHDIKLYDNNDAGFKKALVNPENELGILSNILASFNAYKNDEIELLFNKSNAGFIYYYHPLSGKSFEPLYFRGDLESIPPALSDSNYIKCYSDSTSGLGVSLRIVSENNIWFRDVANTDEIEYSWKNDKNYWKNILSIVGKKILKINYCMG